MRLPRDVSGLHLANALRALGYVVTRQAGDHVRLTTPQNGEHHATIPLHNSLRVGTLAAILADVGQHFSLSREELLRKLSL
jgi:predicted RNA binding protein YcfA (HicA-like mRNA interferase family)